MDAYIILTGAFEGLKFKKGGVPEWTKGADSKSAEGVLAPSGGSNPSSSA